MKIAILTLFPDMLESVLGSSILGRARTQGLLEVEAVDIRPFSDKKHKNTDDYPFGGGAGMVMMAQPIVDAVRHAKAVGFTGPCVYLSPRGAPLTQAKVKALSQHESLVLLCGHYEGVDQRIIDNYIDEEISIGDYILTGGELPAMVLIDCVARFIDGVLGNPESAGEESFSDNLLEYPHYTRPADFMGHTVPEVLVSGHHANVEKWRKEQRKIVTAEKREDLLKK